MIQTGNDLQRDKEFGFVNYPEKRFFCKNGGCIVCAWISQ